MPLNADAPHHAAVDDGKAVAGKIEHVAGMRIGVDHESNGQAGALSRGWNRVFASARLGLYVPFDGQGPTGATEEKYWHLLVEAKGWHPFGIAPRRRPRRQGADRRG